LTQPVEVSHALRVRPCVQQHGLSSGSVSHKRTSVPRS